MMIKSKGLNLFDRMVLWLNWAAVLVLLIGYLAPVVDPRTFWPVAFFGLAYPPMLLINVLFVVYWLFRKQKWALLSVLTILIGWKVLNNNIGFRTPSSVSFAADSVRLKVMTYNVHDFKKYGAKNDVSTKHDILEIIEHEQPDVIGIEEFFSRAKGQYAMKDSIQRILRTSHSYYKPFMGSETDGIGMAIFSKYPIVNTGVIWLKEGERRNLNQCLFADLKKNNKIIRFYAVHLQSIRFQQRDYEYLDKVQSEGKTNISGSRRIGSKLKQAYLKRAEHVDLIKEHAAQCPYPFIIAGDFNDTPSSYAVNKMADGLQNAFREKGSGLGRTYNGDFPNYQIDYIMASKHFKVLTYNVVRKKLSDHYPVYSDLRLN